MKTRLEHDRLCLKSNSNGEWITLLLAESMLLLRLPLNALTNAIAPCPESVLGDNRSKERTPALACRKIMEGQTMGRREGKLIIGRLHVETPLETF